MVLWSVQFGEKLLSAQNSVLGTEHWLY